MSTDVPESWKGALNKSDCILGYLKPWSIQVASGDPRRAQQTIAAIMPCALQTLSYASSVGFNRENV